MLEKGVLEVLIDNFSCYCTRFFFVDRDWFLEDCQVSVW